MPTTLQEALAEFLEKHGIETCALVVRDPDSSDLITHRRGDRVWLIGALEAEKQEIVANWIDVKGTSEK